jgi:class 3 adenylate cyclase/tetratricopeptide (TPR) repeat protein
MLICSECGTENAAGRKFCMECGEPLALACSGCGAANPPAAKFCGECGSPLAGGQTPPHAATVALATPASATTERRLVSVLFADLVGFTTLSESRDSEDVRDVLSSYFDTCRTVVARYGGTVEKFIGDAVMAVWGTPVANEDDAERAVRAALDLVGAVEALGAEVEAPQLKARAGVLTGEATVTLGATGEGMVAGDPVNTASRIQSVAEPGSVYVEEATKRSTDSAIAYADAGTYELKGKVQPVRLYRALRVVAGARGALRSEGLDAPFVGRDRELRLLKDLFHATCDGGKAHLVSVVGIAGIGKSRLSWEFYKYMDGLADAYRWHRGRCLSYGEGVAYWALAEMIRGRANIMEGEAPSSAVAKLHAAVERYVRDPAERRWVEPRLSHLLSLEERAARDKEDLFAAWRLFFERMAEDRPVIMCFEDCQWADASLLEFIDYLLEWSGSHPIFILALSRPELLQGRSGWGTGRSATAMYLEPLPPQAMAALLDGLIPGLPSDVKADVMSRAEGVPLYAVETVRMLLDRGLLVEEGSAYLLVRPVERLEVPETLHALIAARLDGLSASERRLVHDASVLGKTFPRAAIAALSGLPPSELEALLASLVRKEVLGIQADRRSPERGQYGFLQDLLRQVAYETMSKRERRARHLAVASHLEEVLTDEEEIVEVVASHYVQAYDLNPRAEDAPSVRKKAKSMLARAGERAASLAASAEAQRYFEHAAELEDDTLSLAYLHERAGRMAWLGGLSDQAQGHFERAIEQFSSSGDDHGAARCSARLADVDFAGGHLDEAIGRMEKAYEVLSSEEPDEDLAILAAQLGRLLYLRGDLQRSLGPIEAALEIGETLGLPEVVSQALNTKGMTAGLRLHPVEAKALLRMALEVALEHDLHQAALRAYINLGAVLTFADDHRAAIDATDAGAALARKVGDHVWERWLFAAPIEPLVMTGEWDHALLRCEELLETVSPDAAGETFLELFPAVQVHVQRGDLERAEGLLDRLAKVMSEENLQARAALRVATAQVHLADGKASEARADAEEAFSLYGDIGWRHVIFKHALVEALEARFALADAPGVESLLHEMECLRPVELTPYLQAQMARFAARLGVFRSSHSDVEPSFMAAEATFRHLGVPFWLAVTLLEHGERLSTDGRAEARSLLEEARDIFERLHARPWLERLARTAGPQDETLVLEPAL